MSADQLLLQPIRARVLFIDDDPIQLMLLTKLGHKIITEIREAKDGLQGLEIWREWKPDVVVTDIQMPRMNGLEMSLAIKAEDPDAQIIVITSDLSDNSLIEALNIGVDRYISKPVDIQLLADAVRKCLRGRKQIEELQLARQIAALSEALQQEKNEHLALIDRLEEAHNQLLQSEKMASIGQLAAGIAHEINNPVGFVNSNIGTLQQYVLQLFKLLSAYEQREEELAPESRSTLGKIKNEIDLSYLRDDIPSLISESLDGLDRVRKIVQNLKDFSHIGTSEFQWVNLHDGLESTLSVIWNELKYKAEVIRDYGELPEVECIPSELNQVFMNLLVNAAQAIPEHGSITIRTRKHDTWACVEISDTGSGIPPEMLNRIFDPFFTTKPVGKGTGLGLSISHGIIRKHKGRIEVASQPGQGTTFTVRIPIRHEKTD